MGFFEKGVIIYLLLAVAMAFSNPSMVFDSGSAADNTILSWFDIKINTTTNVPYYQPTNGSYNLTGDASVAYNGMVTPQPLAPGTSVLGFLDPLYQAFSWIGALFKTLFSPLIMGFEMQQSGAPPALLFGVLLPITGLFLLALIIWVRSGFV